MAYLGINVAAFTEEPTLATAAWLDFKAHILRLLEAGHVGLARELWESVVEIDHHPALPISALSIEGMPPIKSLQNPNWPSGVYYTPRSKINTHGRILGCRNTPGRFSTSQDVS